MPLPSLPGPSAHALAAAPPGCSERCGAVLPGICRPERGRSKPSTGPSPITSRDPSAARSRFPSSPSRCQGRDSPEFSLSAGQQMTCSVLPLVQCSARYLVGVQGHGLFHAVWRRKGIFWQNCIRLKPVNRGAFGPEQSPAPDSSSPFSLEWQRSPISLLQSTQCPPPVEGSTHHPRAA